jgi:hypothetical protein
MGTPVDRIRNRLAMRLDTHVSDGQAEGETKQAISSTEEADVAARDEAGEEVLKRAFYHSLAIVTAAAITLGVLWTAGKIHLSTPSPRSSTQPYDPFDDPFWPPLPPAPAPPAAPPPIYR